MKRRHDSHSSSSARKCSVRTRTMPVQCEATKIIDLVDDCLFEIYKHLNLIDLASIADVCQRFRSTSQTFFVQSGHEVLHYPSSILTREQLDRDPLDQLVMRTSKVLRNFGAFVTTFDESHDSTKHLSFRVTKPGFNYHCLLRPLDKWSEPREFSHLKITKREMLNFSTEIVELLRKYCADSLIVLKFHFLVFGNELSRVRKPIFPRLQILEWRDESSKYFSRSNALLSIWFPDLREITIETRRLVRRATMRQHFKNLSKATLCDLRDKNSIRRFLIPNPQLRELHVFGCGRDMDFRVLEYIGKYTKEIEVMRLSMRFVATNVEYPSTPNYFSDLKKLKCFELREEDVFHSKGVEIMRSIASTEISLKSLTVDSVETIRSMRADLILEEVLRLKSLEALDLGVVLNSEEDIIRICTQLDNLCELRVDYLGILDTVDLMQIMRVATKLQWLYPRGKLNFGANLSDRLKRALGKRSEHSQFVLRISEEHRTTSLSTEWSPQLEVKHKPNMSECSRVWDLDVCTHTNSGLGKCLRQHAALTEFPVRFKSNDEVEGMDKARRTSGWVPISNMVDSKLRTE